MQRYRLRLVLLNTSSATFDKTDYEQNEIPLDFRLPRTGSLTRWMDASYIPRVGDSIPLGEGRDTEKVRDVVYVSDSEQEYWEVQFHICTETEMVLAFASSQGKVDVGYPGFAWEDGYLFCDGVSAHEHRDEWTLFPDYFTATS
jgi:hypothetical protein